MHSTHTVDNTELLHTHHQLKFNRFFKLEDIVSQGTCAADTMLFFSYITMFKLKQPNLPIDYSSLIKVLNQFDIRKREKLNELQSLYRNDHVILKTHYNFSNLGCE